jgi:hypothetical protein
VKQITTEANDWSSDSSASRPYDQSAGEQASGGGYDPSTAYGDQSGGYDRRSNGYPAGPYDSPTGTRNIDSDAT